MNGDRFYWTPAFDDTGVEVFCPEIWAQRGLQLFEDSGVAINLVNRDWNNEFARFGEKLYIQAPLGFTARRKKKGEDITIQDTRSKQITVMMDQHLHTSFEIDDVDYTLSRDDLIVKYMEPAAKSLAAQADAILSYQCYQFMDHLVGQLGTTGSRSTIVDIKTGMDALFIPGDTAMDRICLLNNNLQSDLLNVESLINANTVGDDGTALRRGHLGEKFGINFFISQKMPTVTSLADGIVTGVVNKSGGYAAGSSSIVVASLSGTPYAGAYVTFAGDMVPHRISSYDSSSLTIALDTPLAYAVANGAAVTVYKMAAINYSDGYAADSLDDMVITTAGVAPQTGQLVSFAGDTERYAALDVSTATSLTLERALVTGVTNTTKAGYGPAGNYSLAFHPSAITLVNRPLRVPPGVMGYTASYNNFSLRFTYGYDYMKQKSIITVDALMGVKVTNEDAGILVLS